MMPMSSSTYAVFLENLEQTITARNLEEYLLEYPGSIPDPDPSYAEWLPVATAQFADMLTEAGPYAEVLTTDSNGLATLTYPSMASPVVAATVVDTSVDNVFFQVAIVSVGATQAVVRVTQSTVLVVLGLSVLSVPSNAVGVPVHVTAFPGT